MRELMIRPILNGYVIQAGCQFVAFTERRTLLNELERYLEHPDKVEAEYRARAVNKPPLPRDPSPDKVEAEYRARAVNKPPLPRDPSPEAVPACSTIPGPPAYR